MCLSAKIKLAGKKLILQIGNGWDYKYVPHNLLYWIDGKVTDGRIIGDGYTILHNILLIYNHKVCNAYEMTASSLIYLKSYPNDNNSLLGKKLYYISYIYKALQNCTINYSVKGGNMYNEEVDISQLINSVSCKLPDNAPVDYSKCVIRDDTTGNIIVIDDGTYYKVIDLVENWETSLRSLSGSCIVQDTVNNKYLYNAELNRIATSDNNGTIKFVYSMFDNEYFSYTSKVAILQKGIDITIYTSNKITKVKLDIDKEVYRIVNHSNKTLIFYDNQDNLLGVSECGETYNKYHIPIAR